MYIYLATTISATLACEGQAPSGTWGIEVGIAAVGSIIQLYKYLATNVSANVAWEEKI